MIMNVNQCASMFDETQHVFKLSAVASQVFIKLLISSPEHKVLKVKRNTQFKMPTRPLMVDLSPKLPPPSSLLWATTPAREKVEATKFDVPLPDQFDEGEEVYTQESTRVVPEKTMKTEREELLEEQLEKNKKELVKVKIQLEKKSKDYEELVEKYQELLAICQCSKQEDKTELSKPIQLENTDLEKKLKPALDQNYHKVKELEKNFIDLVIIESESDDKEDQEQNQDSQLHDGPEKKQRKKSTSSVSSQGNYEELHVEEGVQYRQNPHHHGYQYHHGNDNMSPRHTTHGSPIMQSKFSHEPQSPSHGGNRPFSYGAPMMHSPKHKVAPAGGSHFQYNQHQNGHSNSHPQVLHNYQYNETHSASRATSYGKHESAFHPQPHRPPPHGPPPPPPAGGPGQGHRGSPSPHPQSPKLQRHSTLDQQQRQPLRSPGSPKPIPKLSQRSQSVPTSTMFDPGHIQDQPVAPVSLGGDYMSGYHGDRAPSPPLPPPPPEMLQSSYTENSPSPPPIPTNMTSNVPPHNMQYNYNQSLPTQSATPAVAPAQMTYRQSPQRTEAQTPPPPPPLSSIPKKQNISPDRNVVNISKGASASPSPPSGKVAAVKGGQSNGQKLMSNINNSAATDELQQKLNRMQMRNAVSKRHQWSKEEKEAIKRQFHQNLHIEGKMPNQSECLEAMREEECLSKFTWQQTLLINRELVNRGVVRWTELMS